MSPSFYAFVLALGSGCRIASSAEVSLPIEGPTFVVACNYEFANCSRHAQKHCEGGRFEQITRKNCPRCGTAVPLYPEANAQVQTPSYRGKLYYRCR